MAYTRIDKCDDCGCKMIVVEQSIGSRPMIAVCTHCATKASIDGTAEPTIHDQGALEDEYGIEPSMYVGVRITSDPFGQAYRHILNMESYEAYRERCGRPVCYDANGEEIPF